MSKINILEVLSIIDGSVVLKESERFPGYESGDDVDLLVLDRHDALRKIVNYFEDKYSEEGELRVLDTDEHCHVDFLFGDKLDLRIDLIDSFDFYTKFSVKDGFVPKIFKDRVKKEHGSQSYYVPSAEDDLTIRYFEYIEYFDYYPDKIKHLDYICDVDDENLKERFIKNTHRFIRFKRRLWDEHRRSHNKGYKPESRREALESLIINFRYLVTVTLKTWSKKIFNKE